MSALCNGPFFSHLKPGSQNDMRNPAEQELHFKKGWAGERGKDFHASSEISSFAPLVRHKQWWKVRLISGRASCMSGEVIPSFPALSGWRASSCAGETHVCVRGCARAASTGTRAYASAHEIG